MRARSSLGLVVGALLLAAPAAAAEPLVASPAGSGTACTQAMPCQLEKAIELAPVEGAVRVDAGTYSPLGFFLNKAVDVGGAVGAAATTTIEITSGGLSQVDAPGAVVHDLTFRTSGTAAGLTLLSGTVERVVSSLVGTSGGGACVLDAQGATTPVLRDSVCWAHGATSTQRAGELLLSSGLAKSAVLRNDDFVSTASGGVGLRVSASSPGTQFSVEAVNVIAQGLGEDVRVAAGGGAQAALTLSHSNFTSPASEGGATVTLPTANGNQQGAPLFVNAAGGIFQEAPGSPTLDAGLVDPANGALDLAGALRTHSTCTATSTDIGAYQLVSAAVPPCAPSGGGGGGQAPSNRIALGSLKRNPRTGTAILAVTVPGPGRLALSGGGIGKLLRSPSRAGTLRLRIVPRGAARARLAARGRLRLRVTVSFTPTGGTEARRSRRLTLFEHAG